MTQSITRVFAATDFSPIAGLALDRAARIARRHQARLHIVHAVGWGGLLEETAGTPGLVLDRTRVFEAVAVALERERERLREATGVEAETVVLDDALHRALPEQLASSPEALVVMGAHGEGGWSDALLGSTADRVLRRRVAPVLLVRHSGEEGYRRIALATDFSSASERAARLGLALAPEAVPFLLHANEPPFDSTLALVGVSDETIEDYRRRTANAAMREIEAFAARLGEAGSRALPALRDGRPSRVLPAFVAEADIELMVVGAQGRSRLAGNLLGSTSRHVAAGLPCDVLVVPELA